MKEHFRERKLTDNENVVMCTTNGRLEDPKQRNKCISVEGDCV